MRRTSIRRSSARRTSSRQIAILAAIFCGIAGVVLFRVLAFQTHSVVLRWKAPLPKPGIVVAGYNVYRYTQPDDIKPIASGIKDLTYTDQSARRGMTYYYFVKAVGTNGNESPPSEAVSAVIPSY